MAPRNSFRRAYSLGANSLAQGTAGIGSLLRPTVSMKNDTYSPAHINIMPRITHSHSSKDSDDGIHIPSRPPPKKSVQRLLAEASAAHEAEVATLRAQIAVLRTPESDIGASMMETRDSGDLLSPRSEKFPVEVDTAVPRRVSAPIKVTQPIVRQPVADDDCIELDSEATYPSPSLSRRSKKENPTIVWSSDMSSLDEPPAAPAALPPIAGGAGLKEGKTEEKCLDLKEGSLRRAPTGEIAGSISCSHSRDLPSIVGTPTGNSLTSGTLSPSSLGKKGMKRSNGRIGSQTGSIMSIMRHSDEKPTSLQMVMEKFVNGHFDRFCSAWIVANVVFICIELQYNGSMRGLSMGVANDEPIFQADMKTPFLVSEHIFNAVFLFELMLRLSVFRLRYFFDNCTLQKGNMFDSILVIATSLDLYFAESSGIDLNVLRPLRFLRLLRTLRVLQTVKVFEKLKILVNTHVASVVSLFWSIVLLVIVQLMASLFLCQSCAPILEGQYEVDFFTQEWVYINYGTTGRAFYTVFELTFSGGWPNYARTLVDEVSAWFAVFFFIYIIGVTFAMFRIITALFIRDTLAVAANDAESAVQEKLRQRSSYALKLVEFFEAADVSDDGYLTLDEFEGVLSDEKVRTWLSIMEIDIHETTEFFSVLANGDGLVSAEEFVQGILRLKGGARSQDVMALQRTTARIANQVQTLVELCARLEVDVTRTHRDVQKARQEIAGESGGGSSGRGRSTSPSRGGGLAEAVTDGHAVLDGV